MGGVGGRSCLCLLPDVEIKDELLVCPGAVPADRATDAAIDKQVYELYGLTEEEIAIVEGRQ